MVSSGRDFVFGPYTRVRWRFDSCAHHVVVVDRAVVVGHGQATSRPIRSRSIEQGTSYLHLMKEREKSRPIVPASLIGASLRNRRSLFLK